MSHAEAYRQEKAIKGFDHDWKRRLIDANEKPDDVVYIGSGKSQ
jgi:predicted GIY-YIG superfamily endonuclease